MDFVKDRLEDGRKLGALTIGDDFTTESVDIVLDHGMGSRSVVRAAEDTVRFRWRALHRPGPRVRVRWLNVICSSVNLDFFMASPYPHWESRSGLISFRCADFPG